jgi:hypothetical protein
MSSNRHFSRCEKRKAPAAVAAPDLGRLTMPHKTNHAAARTVASGDVLWDKRKCSQQGSQARFWKHGSSGRRISFSTS